MKKIITLLMQGMLFAFLCNNGNAQNKFPTTGAVGIGTLSPNASALLEIKSTTKGVLVPRMTLAKRNAISLPATGLLIYQTNNAPGFYYYNGTVWTPVASKTGWSLTGNAGTNANTNFIGTTDAQSLVFKVNNLRAGLIDYSTCCSGTRNTAFGQIALNSVTSGADNTATGYGALYTNSTGNQNAAYGKYALFNSNADNNSAYGFNAMFFNETGSGNTAIGATALQNNTKGSNNVAVGNYALGNNITGSNNTAIGFNAQVSVSAALTNATAIGANAIVDISNAIVLGNNVNVGIGTTSPTFKLDVCGTIRAKELRVETGWCDYVFDKNYKLRSLSDVENFIKANKHLPDVTAGNEIESNGLEVGKVSSQMIKKIEELTLYVIEQEKSINNLKEQNAKLEHEVSLLIRKAKK